MYTGTIKKESKFKIKYPTKFQIVTIEQYEHNGVIMEKFVTKTKDFSADPKIKVRDFDIKNLMAINALGELKTSTLQKPIEQIEREAMLGNQMIQRIDLLNELEQNEQPTQTQTENA